MDNGEGIPPEKLLILEEKLKISDTSSGKSIGLTNVHKRIRLYYGEEYGMSIKSRQGAGTTIRLTLPRVHEKRSAALKQETGDAVKTL